MLTMQASGQGYGMPRQYGSGVGKDHLRENVRRMRQIQRQSRQREQETQKPVKGLWQSEKYRDIPSRIKVEQDKGPDAPRPHSAHFLRSHSGSGPPVKLESRPCTPDPQLSVPPASSANDVEFVRNNIDFIKVNGRAARHGQMVPRAPSLTALDDLKKKQEDNQKKYRKGAVPSYLKARQEQWKKDEEDRIANTPDPSIPDGHRVLPDAERAETLRLLKKSQQDLTMKLASLPLRTDTYRMRSCKQELENKLSEMEEAIRIFSRPKVFVKSDS